MIPKFQMPVRTRNMDDSVGQAVVDMRDGSFSQLPIMANGAVAAVLTAETVARWLASEVENEFVSPWDTKIESVLGHTEDLDHYCFLRRDSNLLDALSKFEAYAALGKKLDAILITDKGKTNQGLLGILTLYDLPAVLAELGLKKLSATRR